MSHYVRMEHALFFMGGCCVVFFLRSSVYLVLLAMADLAIELFSSEEINTTTSAA